MNKWGFIILLVLITASEAGALTNVPYSNASGSEIIHTSYNIIPLDNAYQFNSSDVLRVFDASVTLNSYPNTQLYSFVDKFNNIVSVKYTFTKSQYVFYKELTRRTEVYLNGETQRLYVGGDSGYNTTYYDESVSFLGYGDSSDIDNKIMFDGVTIILSSNFHIGVSGASDREVRFQKEFYPQIINLPVGSEYDIYNIDIFYMNKKIAILHATVDEAYNKLNFIFKFTFMIIKMVLWIPSSIYLISDSDYIEYQKSALMPLQMVDTILNVFISSIKFMVIMGISFTVLFVECLIFIFAYLRTRNGDIVETIGSFSQNSYDFWNRCLIQPITWVFEKIIKIWA